MSEMNNLNDLFLHTLKDIHYAEKTIRSSLSDLIDKVDSAELKSAIESHLEEHETHMSRIEDAFKTLGQQVESTTCPAIEGIAEETKELTVEIKDADTRDAAIISAIQAMNHYEIVRYGTLCVWADTLGHDDAKNLLEENLSEAKDADQELTHLAEGGLNREAMAA